MSGKVSQREHGSTAGPHTAPRRSIREPTTLESLARWSTVLAPTQNLMLRKQARRLSEFARPRPPSGGEEEVWESSDEADDWAEAAAIDVHASDGEPVRSASWHTVAERRLLLLTYAHGVQIWDASGQLDGNLTEMLNLRSPDTVLRARLIPCPPSLSTSHGSATAAQSLLAVLSASSSSFTLTLYSLHTKATIRIISVPSSASDFQANTRAIIVSCVTPPSLHMYSTDTFEPLPSSPLLDVSSPPVFALSPSRSFSYASTTPTQRAKSGILAGRGRWRDEEREDQNEAGGQGAAAPVDIGQAARRLVSSGVKAIGEYGWSYINTRTSYSRSAPDAGDSSDRRAPPASFVRVIDLADLSIQAHFRPTHGSVAILSFAPAGNMLLTGSSEGRSFHVFELRGKSEGRVWHRYDLSRGMSAGRADDVSWSEDGKFVAISTARGTAHVYAVTPFGGQPDLGSLFRPGHRNADEVPPLSMPMPALVRLRSPLSSQSTASTTSPSPQARSGPAIAFLPATSGSRTLALYYPHLASLVLDRLVYRPRSSEPSSPSGMAQLMRARDAIKPSSSVKVQHQSVWALQRAQSWQEMQTPLSPLPAASVAAGSSRWSAQVELHTFSRSPRVLPPSIYLSYQFDFCALPPGQAAACFAKGNLAPQPSKRVPVRHEVELIAGGEEGGEDLQMLMRSALGLAGTSPVSRIAPPAFPNGISATRGPALWQRAIPMIAAAASVGGRTPSSASTTPHSVSFEDDDAVRDIDNLTPNTTSLGDPAERDGDDGWGFETNEPLTSSPTRKAAVHIVSTEATTPSPPQLAVVDADYDDFSAGLLDEQHSERAEVAASLPPPIEPTRPARLPAPSPSAAPFAGSGSKKRKGKNGRMSASPASASPGR